VSVTAVSLFAGIEGIGLALHRAGVSVKAAVEIDDAARGVITDHFPDTALMTDVTKVSADDLLAAGFVPERGLVAAGWPCQGNSVAGRRGGMADPRSGLWVHVARLLAELRPRWFLGENVPGLLSVNDGRDFATVVDDLAHLGYGFCWRVLDAQHFGVPQRRRRVFIVGCAGDRATPVQVLLEPESSGGHSAPRPAARQGIARSLTTGSGGGRYDRQPLVAETLRSHPRPGSNSNGAIVTALTSNMAGGGGGADDNTAQGGHLVPFAVHENQRGEITTSQTAGSLKTGGGKPGQGYPAIVTRDIAQALTSNYGKQPDNSDTNLGPTLVTHALTAEGADAGEDGTGRGTPLTIYQDSEYGVAEYDTAGSLRAGRIPEHQMIAATTAVRRLTPLECERLQGFPDHWTATSNGKPQSDSARYRQLGNAVAVPVVEWIARRIAAVDGAA
jgi:DNA (cytosine-5)-methyltransferase 1